MSNVFKPLTASEVKEMTGTSLYVLNRSDRSGNSRSELLMTIASKGVNKNVRVPNTWIPIDLTSQIPDINAIRENEDFLYHFRKKMIVVIDTETAETALKRRDAQEEYNRVYDIQSMEIEDNDEIDLHEHQASGGKKSNPKLATANPKVLNIVNKESLTENNKILALKNIKNELKKDDYRYIINQPKTENNEKLKMWASQQLDN